ncbi:MAG: PQQ-binding-like beta-propeller repeat protein [Methylocapsa sp.]|nr:PQQ-binding-like beta-propeller repeat protein [Methylocapsa sp.]
MKNKLLFGALTVFGLVLALGAAAAQATLMTEGETGTPIEVGPAVDRASTGNPVRVTTYHYDTFRTGWNPHETTLTATGFPDGKGSPFGIIAAQTGLDDQIDAQPLVMPGLTIAGGTHDVVYVATESNTVYALDASTGAILKSRNLGAAVPSGPGARHPHDCPNNAHHVGINGTPVIDAATNTLYLIAYVNGSPPTYFLHALNLSTLTDKVARQPINASNTSHKLVNGAKYTFNPDHQRQRPGLLLMDGKVYAGFGSFCDFSAVDSRGWLLGWDVSKIASGTITPLPANKLDDTDVTCPSPFRCSSTSFFLSSIWMSGYGLSGVSPNIFFATGNSDCNFYTSPEKCPSATTYDGVNNIQESVVRLNEDLSQAGIFTPSNVFGIDRADGDLGSGGVLALPTQSGSAPYLLVAAGKIAVGKLYLLNRLPAPGSSKMTVLDSHAIENCHCGPGYFVGQDGVPRIVTSTGHTSSNSSAFLRTWLLNLSPSPKLSPGGTATINSGQDGGFFTAVSCNSAKKAGQCDPGTGIIWAVSRPTGTPTTVNLYAFGSYAVSGALPQLFVGAAGSWPHLNGNANIVPVVANGKVYVASAFLDGSGQTRGQLDIFGACASGCPKALVMVSPVSPLPTPYAVSGILQTVSGSTLTLKKRTGGSATVDASQAMANQAVGTPLNPGVALTAAGSSIDPKGALAADAIYRAKGESGDLWPPDKDPN